MSRVTHAPQSPDAILNQALEASFRDFQPYHRPIPMAVIMAKLRANHHGACPMPDAELKIIVARYAALYGFNMGGD